MQDKSEIDGPNSAARQNRSAADTRTKKTNEPNTLQPANVTAKDKKNTKNKSNMVTPSTKGGLTSAKGPKNSQPGGSAFSTIEADPMGGQSNDDEIPYFNPPQFINKERESPQTLSTTPSKNRPLVNKNRPKSSTVARGRKMKKNSTDLSYAEPAGFGDNVKGGISFGPPKKEICQSLAVGDKKKPNKMNKSRSSTAINRPKTAKSSQKQTVASTRNLFNESNISRSGGPGTYADAKQFGDEAKSFTISAKRDQPIEQTTGPGDYDHERSLSATKYRNPAWKFDPERPDKEIEIDHRVPSPGYDAGKNFGKETKSFTIGEKREEKPQMTPDPYIYDNLQKPQGGYIDPKSPARPSTFASQVKDQAPGPGSYPTGKEFGKDVKSHKFSSTERPPPRQAAPGDYHTDIDHIKTKSPVTRINKEERPDNFTRKNESQIGPGAYSKAEKKFGEDVKTFSIGRKKEQRIERTAGPGEYNLDRAEKATKTRTNSAVISKAKRPNNFKTKANDAQLGPGSYPGAASRNDFGKQTKKITMGSKRPVKVELTLGPGAYDITKSEKLTRASSPTTKMDKSPARPSSFAHQSQGNTGPGQYSGAIKPFGKDVKSFKIGQKREKPIETTSGPGQYNPEIAEKITKNKMPDIILGKSPSRPSTLAKAGAEFQAAPGQYDDGKRFNTGVKGFKIGEKREQSIAPTAGPGEYNAERGESLTKTKMPNIDMGKSPSRPRTFAQEGTEFQAAPGQYDDGVRFNSGVKGFKIQEKREQKIELTAGPGEYNADRADSLTKAKVPNIDMGKSPSRPHNFAPKGTDFQAAPGQYDDGKRFNSGVKGFKIGEKREEVIQSSAGPGQYSPERAEILTKTKSPNINLGSSPSRPSTFANKGIESQTAPGQYDDGKRFNSDVKGFKIGEKRELPITRTAGPGEYNAERADSLTKAKIQNIDLGKSPSRPNNFANKGTESQTAPGQYDDGKRFNSGVKGFKIGEKREEKFELTAGPGQYSPEVADNLTKSKTPNINLGSSPSRPSTFANKGAESQTAPGQYDDGMRFNSGVKGFKIGEKREEMIQSSAGPGQYSPERADSLTKTKVPNIDLGKSPSRPRTLANMGSDFQAAPGQYDDGVRFNSGVKGFKIGEKREEMIQSSAGPGQYSPERADSLTKTKVPNIDMGKSPSRPHNFAPKGTDFQAAPGQYDDGKRFNSDVKGFKIGEKREEVIQSSAGPGQYSPERAEILTKTKTPNINLGSSPSRPSTFANKGMESQTAPGQYDDGMRFNSGVKGFKIGEKREERFELTAGPGQYSPEVADNLTKQKIPNINLGSSPSRPQSFAKVGSEFQGAPGQYESGVKFGQDVKSFKIGEKREEKIVSTAGPGQYSPERAESLTKSKTPNINLGSSPSRPHNFAPKGTDFQAAPGLYDDGKRFNSGVKGFKIGEKRDEIIQDTVGPGTYSPEVAEALTKQKIPNINLGSSPSRPSTFARDGSDFQGAPGQYESGVKFGQDTKGFKIGEKRDEKIQKSAGPGEYDHTRAEALTKSKSGTIKFGLSPERPSTFSNIARGDQAAPGQYDSAQNFGKDTKSFTIGERRQQKIEPSPGPGEYDQDKADPQTRTRSPEVIFSPNMERNTFALSAEKKSLEDPLNQRQYFHNLVPEEKKSGPKAKKTATNKPQMTRNSVTQKTPQQPVLYSQLKPKTLIVQEPVKSSLNNSRSSTKVKAKTPARRTNVTRAKKPLSSTFATQPKKSVQFNSGMGPGTYDTSKADALTRPKTSSTHISKTKRSNNFKSDINTAPGQYDVSGATFGSNVKSFTIGEKRETRQEQSPGPGSYSPRRSDSATKVRSSAFDFEKQVGRTDSGSRNDSPDIDLNIPRFYEYPKETPIYTIPEKREERVQDSPGPGAYDISFSQTKPNAPGAARF